MPKDDRIYIRVSEAKKKRIQKRADSLDRSITAHLLYCFDQEQAISEGRSVVIPSSKQGSSEGKSIVEELESDPNFPF